MTIAIAITIINNNNINNNNNNDKNTNHNVHDSTQFKNVINKSIHAYNNQES